METVDLKLVLLGQPGVGKTCLVYRYLYNTFGETISVRAQLLSLPLRAGCNPAGRGPRSPVLTAANAGA